MVMMSVKRVLVKLSGEALMGEQRFGQDPATIARICNDIKEAVLLGYQICIVVGGGNICRGANVASMGIERVSGDYMGMLATAINALALQSVLERGGVMTRVQSAIPMEVICEPYIRRRAIRHMEKGRVVIFACGTGNPFFTTDAGAALRASELDVDLLLKATKVDGVYSADPKKYADAKRYERLSYRDVITQDLEIMDTAAITLARDNNIPIGVFNILVPGGLAKLLQGEGYFTLITD